MSSVAAAAGRCFCRKVSSAALVLVFEPQTKTISLMNQGQRGASAFLTPDSGLSVVLLVIAPPSQELEPPKNPERFTFYVLARSV